MYFKQVDEIITGTKTQTRRIVRVGEELWPDYVNPQGGYSPAVVAKRLKWQVGRDYAVSPGRGKSGVWIYRTGKAVSWLTPTRKLSRLDMDISLSDGWKPLRIRLLEIRREPLQDITEVDARAEGYPEDEDERKCGYCDWGEQVVDPPPSVACICSPATWYRDLWNSINTRKGTRWDDSPHVWVLEFEVVR